ncbi:unnamed protein product [Pedinophyceae sp. YPF-701]|nr:unnamed protein product [Pedinophyceae sp. YPF-701]
MWVLLSAGETAKAPGQAPLETVCDFAGRQIWHYDESVGTDADREAVEEKRRHFVANKQSQKHSGDELLRLQMARRGLLKHQGVDHSDVRPGAAPTDAQVRRSILAGGRFHEGLQQDDGHWPADYGGPMFLMPGLVIAVYVTGTMDEVLTPQHKAEMIRYLRNHQNERDGGWGLHIEGHSTMFGTALNYVALRLLGVPAMELRMVRAREWILAHGGATHITSWGKFWLSVLGCYDWMGQNPLPPEMWLLPYSKWTGIGYFHPGRFWCHCRMVYLPMCYIYAKRATGPLTDVVLSLRKELFVEPYERVDWNAARNKCAAEDLYYPHPAVQDALWWALYKCENVLPGTWLRERAMREVMKHVHYEDRNTRYIDIGPVNKVINMLCCYFEGGPDCEAFRKHLPRLHDYLWVAEDGMKMQGYNGVQLWDTAFSVQAYAAAGADLLPHFHACLRKANAYIERAQVMKEAEGDLDEYYRHRSRGAWPFSTSDHGWPISDCSSEGLKASLMLMNLPESAVGRHISEERLRLCGDVILSYQNQGKGWASYENTRSFEFLELLNPAETFGDIIVDYSYVECSSACMTALSMLAARFPDYRPRDVKSALKQGRDFICREQREDGSWYGSWAVCFTYASWFGCKALAAVGDTLEGSAVLRKACEFLVSKQRENGGWGESYLSCQDKVYTHLPDGASHVVNTSWAMLALLAAGYHEKDRAVLDRAAAYLLKAQDADGGWPQQQISGVFNRNAMISYSTYRYYFPIWALGEYRTKVLGAGK